MLMTVPAIAIRTAVPADAPRIAQTHVACWRETYAGMLPDEALAALSVADRTALWERIITQSSSTTTTFVVDQGDGIAAFGACGVQRDADLARRGFAGEVSSIYVLASAQKRGVGAALMRAMSAALTTRGLVGMSLWVLRENAIARRFYDRLGGQVLGERTERRPFGEIVEVSYGWPDLQRLSH
jgi:ribosomal protein S18 acetylase RimI-like enzyme